MSIENKLKELGIPKNQYGKYLRYREKILFLRMKRGFEPKQIAKILQISYKTIQYYIYPKLRELQRINERN